MVFNVLLNYSACMRTYQSCTDHLILVMFSWYASQFATFSARNGQLAQFFQLIAFVVMDQVVRRDNNVVLLNSLYNGMFFPPR